VSGEVRRVFLSWKALAGLAISALLLYFAFRDIDLREVAAEIRRADPPLFLLAVFLATAVFVIRAMRWKPLLDAVRPGTSFRARYAATNIGFMANNLLPARVGEFVRAFALGRLARVPLVASFASLVVERTLDGLTIVTFLFIAMAAPAFPGGGVVGGRDMGSVAAVLAIVFGLFTLALLGLVLAPQRSVRAFEATVARWLPRAVRRPVVDALDAFLTGLGALRRPALLIPAVAWSIGLWLFNALGFWVAFRAFGIDVPFVGALFLQSIITLAVAIPSAPGFFGVFEAAARLGLVDVWGVEAGKAMGFAIGFHLGGFVPVTLIGLFYAWRMGLSWREVGHAEEVVEEAVETSLGERSGLA
jgi:glycosyltransferase 2 family protein